MSERVCLFGGSFNPVHNGHLIVARAVAEQMKLTGVILLPSASPPHKAAGELLAGDHRHRMLEIATEGDELFRVSDFDLVRPGPAYTIDTVTHFRSELGADADLHWLIGADSLVELPTWHRAPELVEACRILTAMRPGWEDIDWRSLEATFRRSQIERLQAGVVRTPLIGISATEVRKRLRAGRSVRYLVPDAVTAYIRDGDLYRGRQTDTAP